MKVNTEPLWYAFPIAQFLPVRSSALRKKVWDPVGRGAESQEKGTLGHGRVEVTSPVWSHQDPTVLQGRDMQVTFPADALVWAAEGCCFLSSKLEIYPCFEGSKSRFKLDSFYPVWEVLDLLTKHYVYSEFTKEMFTDLYYYRFLNINPVSLFFHE